MTHSYLSGQGEQSMPTSESFIHQCLLCIQVLGTGQAKCIRDFCLKSPAEDTDPPGCTTFPDYTLR